MPAPQTRPLASRRWLAPLALAAACVAGPAAHATPLDFSLINVSTSLQSRVELNATANLAGVPLVAAPQFAPGGLNGAGSQSTLYNNTGNGSQLNTVVTQQSIGFLDTGGAIARNATGSFGNNLAISPGLGGVSGTAPANYGVNFSSPQSIAIPPIDLTPFGVPLTLNLGTLSSIDARVALRGVVLDVVSAAPLPLSAYSATPDQSFDASWLQVGISGTADVLLGATARQASFADYLAAGVALTALQASLADQGVSLTIVNNGFSQLSYTIGIGLSTALPDSLSANSASFGTLAQVGGNLRLTVPIGFDVLPSTPVDFLFSAQYGFSGTLVGQVPFVVVEVPEPGTWALWLAGLAGLGAWRRARRRGSRHLGCEHPCTLVGSRGSVQEPPRSSDV
jgi:opacity protein-like surface antigen